MPQKGVAEIRFTTACRPSRHCGTGHVVPAIVWGGAAAGIALTLFWPTAPRWLSVMLYLLLGWVAVWYAGREYSASHFQHIAHLGACGKTGVMPQNRWPKPELTGSGVAKWVSCPNRDPTMRWWLSGQARQG